MRKLVLAALLMALFIGGCSSTTQTSGTAASAESSAQQPVQPAAPAATDETAPDAEAMEGEAVTETGYLYPACADVDGVEKWGYINEKGEFVIEPQYKSADPFTDFGLATVVRNDMEGVIDTSGKFVLKPEYDFITGIFDNVVIAHNETEGYMLLNLQGDILFVTNQGIGGFQDDLASYAIQYDDSTVKYGYIDKKGRVVIEPIFDEAYDFSNGEALVRLKENRYAIIDKTGKTLTELDYAIFGGISDGMLVYRAENEKYGYLRTDGSMLTEAVYLNAMPFENGFAPVDTSDDYANPKYGLIDKNGKYVIEPGYGGITSLGEGRFAVTESNADSGWNTFCKKALFSDKGEQLTDMAYYDISMFSKGISSITTDTETILIGLDGKPLEQFGKFYGAGDAKCVGELIDVFVDGELTYLTKDGKEVWKSERVFRLKNGAVVKQAKYRPDRCLLVLYPVVSGHPDTSVQEKINKFLRDRFVGDDPVSPKENGVYTESTESMYEISQVGALLVVREDSYLYPIGAAHGTPGLEVFHIDPGTGKTYSLKDLFRKGSDYTGRITELINKQIKENAGKEDSMYLVDKVEEIAPDQGFILTNKTLQIYFQVYEIAAYAAGQPTFDIQYNDIIDLIDTDSELWKLVKDGLDYGK